MSAKHLKTLLLSVMAAVSSCGLDNYEEPKSKLRGQVVYNGEPVGLRGTGEAVQLQLYQDGYELRRPIPVHVGQDGAFEASLFDGTYKLVTRDNNGPWANDRDTTIVHLQGSASVEVAVRPFFVLAAVQLSLNGNSASASFRIDEVAGGRAIDYALVLVGKTSFVDDVSYTERRQIGGVAAGSTVAQSVSLADNADFKAGSPLFARVALRPVGTDQAIYSPVVRLR